MKKISNVTAIFDSQRKGTFVVNINDLFKRGTGRSLLTFGTTVFDNDVLIHSVDHGTTYVEEVEIMPGGSVQCGEIILHCRNLSGTDRFTLNSDIIITGEVESVIFC